MEENVLSTCLNLMVKETIRLQEKNYHLSYDMTKLAYLKEHCTIKLCGPRRSGHTTAGLKIAKMFNKTLYIVPTFLLKRKIAENEKHAEIISVENVLKDLLFRGKHKTESVKHKTESIDCFIVDCSSMISKSEIEEIYIHASVFGKKNTNNNIFRMIETFYNSIGIIRYGKSKENAVVDIDQEISNYYRSLMPKYIKLDKQKYPAHISFVRKEIVPNIHFWNKYNGLEIEFKYSNIVLKYGPYFCIGVICPKLEEIREELGLNKTRGNMFSYPFHITIGNVKKLNI